MHYGAVSVFFPLPYPSKALNQAMMSTQHYFTFWTAEPKTHSGSESYGFMAYFFLYGLGVTDVGSGEQFVTQTPSLSMCTDELL